MQEVCALIWAPMLTKILRSNTLSVAKRKYDILHIVVRWAISSIMAKGWHDQHQLGVGVGVGGG